MFRCRHHLGPKILKCQKKSNGFPQNIPHTKHPKEKTHTHTHLRGVRNEVKLTGPSAQAPLRTDPIPNICFWQRDDLRILLSQPQIPGPRPFKGVKFQPPGLFLVVQGPRFQTLGGFRHMKLGLVVSSHSCMEKMEKSHSRFEPSPNFRG